MFVGVVQMVLFEIVLPAFLIFLSGYLVQKKFQVSIRGISVISLYIMMPALTFHTFFTIELNVQILYAATVSILLMFALMGITKLACRLLGYDAAGESAMMLVTVFMNSGNYGAPIVLFAFGRSGFNFAVLIMVFHLILMSIFGVYLASRGKQSTSTSIMNILKMPSIYAMVIGLLFQVLHINIPDTFLQAFDLVGQASVPTVMILLGMQLAELSLKDFDWKAIGVGTVIRLLLSPLVTWAICLLFPLESLLQKVLILTAAMPSAATVLMYAIEFEAKPQFVSSATFVSTVISFFSIALCLFFLL
jgi:malate permease and related proteins